MSSNTKTEATTSKFVFRSSVLSDAKEKNSFVEISSQTNSEVPEIGTDLIINILESNQKTINKRKRMNVARESTKSFFF
jgi:hypothetical protein